MKTNFLLKSWPVWTQELFKSLKLLGKFVNLFSKTGLIQMTSVIEMSGNSCAKKNEYQADLILLDRIIPVIDV